MLKASRVFVIEPVRNYIDISKAQKYGEIIYIFNHEDRRCSAWEHVHFGQEILQRLKALEFDSKTDFICIVGAMLTVSITAITVAQHYDKFNILLFNSVNDAYVKRRFDKNDWEGEP